MRNKSVTGPIFTYPANFRAEDGARRTTPWNDLCDEVLVPIGSLLCVFLICVVIVVLN